jgi:hypothetical protein
MFRYHNQLRHLMDRPAKIVFSKVCAQCQAADRAFSIEYILQYLMRTQQAGRDNHYIDIDKMVYDWPLC